MAGDFDPWIGRTEEAEDSVPPAAARRLLATLDPVAPPRPLAAGDPLPPLWHWIAWTPEAATLALGRDGHPARGGFLPPVPLERRMWAGGRLEFLAPLSLGEVLHRRSTVRAVTEKTGGAGRMVFVTVAHEISGAAGLAIREEQDIVYVAMPDRWTPPPPPPAPEGILWRQEVTADAVRLFRFSALTFNAHRIHYDLPYATGVEKYPALVVHGPLQAMLLAEAAQARAPGRGVARFRFRGLRPAFHDAPLTLAGTAEGRLATLAPDGGACMTAEIGFAS